VEVGHAIAVGRRVVTFRALHGSIASDAPAGGRPFAGTASLSSPSYAGSLSTPKGAFGDEPHRRDRRDRTGPGLRRPAVVRALRRQHHPACALVHRRPAPVDDRAGLPPAPRAGPRGPSRAEPDRPRAAPALPA